MRHSVWRDIYSAGVLTYQILQLRSRPRSRKIEPLAAYPVNGIPTSKPWRTPQNARYVSAHLQPSSGDQLHALPVSIRPAYNASNATFSPRLMTLTVLIVTTAGHMHFSRRISRPHSSKRNTPHIAPTFSGVAKKAASHSISRLQRRDSWLKKSTKKNIYP